MMNQGVHTVDLLIAAMGRPVEVFAYTGTLAHERVETEDVAVAVVKFESGALGVIHATTAAYPGLSARVQVHGDKGSVVIDNDELTYIHRAAYAGDQRDVSYGANSATDNQKDSLDLPDKATVAAGRDPGQLSDAHRAQYLNILAALQGREKLRVDLETNRQAISVITGAYESARTGKPVVLS
jgi:predicted dehydrogenase